jgi:hypothetical protein
VAQDDRGGPAQDHAPTGGRELQDVGLKGAPDVVVVVATGGW